MHFDTALNLIWLLLGIGALVSTVRSAFHRRGGPKKSPIWLHVVGVALIVIALFPYISATDDVLRVEHLSGQHDQQHSSRHSNDDLIRLYETMDTPLVARSGQVSLTLFFVFLVGVVVQKRIDRSAPYESGRSPPALLPA